MESTCCCEVCEVREARYSCKTCKSGKSKASLRCSKCHFEVHRSGDQHQFTVEKSQIPNIREEARKYLETTVKELEIPLSGDGICDVDYHASAMPTMTRFQSFLDEKVNRPMEAAVNDLQAKKLAWKQEITANFNHYRESHEHHLLTNHQKLLETVIPSLSCLEQLSRGSAREDEDEEEIAAHVAMMDEIIYRRTVHQVWEDTFSNLKTTPYPLPRVTIPDKINKAIELLREGIAEMELSIEKVSAAEPLIAQDSDWFSYQNMEPLVGHFYHATLMGSVGSDGELTAQFCGSAPNSLSRDEVVALVTARLKYRLGTADPSLRPFHSDYCLSVGTDVAVCRKAERGFEAFRGRIEEVDLSERRCIVRLVDFGRSETFAIEELYLDENARHDLKSIPPLTVTFHLFPPQETLERPETVEAAIKEAEAENGGCFPLRIVAEYFHNSRLVREIFISEKVRQQLPWTRNVDCETPKKQKFVPVKSPTESPEKKESPPQGPRRCINTSWQKNLVRATIISNSRRRKDHW